MASTDDMVQRIEELTDQDRRYKKEAYFFLYAALDYTVRKLGRQQLASESERHVTGRELLAGISDYAWLQYGMMTQAVFSYWGITQTVDLGEMVFNLVAARLMNKTDQDTLDDFRDVYDFSLEFDWDRRRERIEIE